MQEPAPDSVTRKPTRTPVPRGIARTGPALLSYGFRPFFLLAGVFALVAMSGWIGALALGWPLGGDYGALNWHAHEMLFGYTSAALAGFMLTTIPNWTGRLPVSGTPLLGLVGLWCAGRIAMAMPDTLGLPYAITIDSCFLPLMGLIAAREIVAGKNWKNLKILGGLVALSAANLSFHGSVLVQGHALEMSRAAVAIYVVLISVVGGRIVPSFSRNWLAKAGSPKLPAPFGRFDVVAIVTLALAGIGWVLAEAAAWAAALSLVAATLQAVRLLRWQGWRTTREPLLLVLHVGYGFVPAGFFCVALAQLGLLSTPSALHVLTVGAIGLMTFAVMTRASLGHTGRPMVASARTTCASVALGLAAAIRPLAEMMPEHYLPILAAAATGWIVAFGLFLSEYGPILSRRGR